VPVGVQNNAVGVLSQGATSAGNQAANGALADWSGAGGLCRPGGDRAGG
jgi:hypothetical protein